MPTRPTRQQFIDLLGLQLDKHPLDAVKDYKQIDEFHDKHYSRYKVEYRSNGKWIPAYILKPAKLPRRQLPGIVVPHTHGSNWNLGKSEMVGLLGDPSLALARDLVKQGYIVIAPDSLGFEERKIPSAQDPEGQEGAVGFHNLTTQLNLEGDNYLRYCIEETSRAVDVLQTMAEVNEGRIGIVGYSFGGHVASKTAAFDERIYATVALGCVANIRTKVELGSKLDPTENVAGLLKLGDTEDLLRLISPRALLICGSKNDPYAPKSREVFQFLKHSRLKKKDIDKLEFLDSYQGGHDLTPRMKTDALNWLKKQMYL